jgi:hypothetical protein
VQLADLSAGITAGFIRTLAMAAHEFADTQPAPREFVRRVVALDPVIDQTLGESALAKGHSAQAIAQLSRLDDALAANAVGGQGTEAILQARGSILILSEVLAKHAAFFDHGAQA